MLRGEATNTNFVFGLTRPGLETKIYRTCSEYANQYTTDAVAIVCNFESHPFMQSTTNVCEIHQIKPTFPISSINKTDVQQYN